MGLRNYVNKLEKQVAQLQAALADAIPQCDMDAAEFKINLLQAENKKLKEKIKIASFEYKQYKICESCLVEDGHLATVETSHPCAWHVCKRNKVEQALKQYPENEKEA